MYDFDDEGDALNKPDIGDKPEVESGGRQIWDTAFDVDRIYFRDLSRHALLSAEDEIRLGRLVQKGDVNARNRMIEANLRLVVKLCMRYRNSSMPLMDLVEEGNLGLFHAVEKFNPEMGVRFSTYAVWWIRQAVDRAIMNHSATVRVPIHVHKRMRLYRKVERELWQDNPDSIKAADVAEALGEQVERVRELFAIQKQAVSLDQEHGESGMIWLTLVCDEADAPEQRLLQEEEERLIERFLNQLGSREREVLVRRYGMYGHECSTLEEIGKAIGLTRERVRQIQTAAISHLQDLVRDQQQGPALPGKARPLMRAFRK